MLFAMNPSILKEYLKFLKNPAILRSLVIILVIEIILQLGCYRKFLKRNSYAANINRILDHVISKKNEMDPNVLIVGTSLAYQGLSVPLLNERLSGIGLKVQSIAIPGSELVVQELALEKVLLHFKKIRYIIHVNEAELPWSTDRRPLEPTMAMVSELDRVSALRKLYEYNYDVRLPDLFFLYFRLVAYRNDFGDLVLNPDKRIKAYGRERILQNSNFYEYDNQKSESLDLYDFKNIKECLEKTSSSSEVKKGSDSFHKHSIFKTCEQAEIFGASFSKTDETELYFKRLNHLYQFAKKNDIIIINVFQPMPYYLDFIDYPTRIEFWKEHYRDNLGNHILNLNSIISSEESPKYFYDLIHLNRKGKEIFSNSLADSILLLKKRGEL